MLSAGTLLHTHHTRKNINNKKAIIISSTTDIIITLCETGSRVFLAICLPLMRYIEKLSFVTPSQYDRKLFVLSLSVSLVRIVYMTSSFTFSSKPSVHNNR